MGSGACQRKEPFCPHGDFLEVIRRTFPAMAKRKQTLADEEITASIALGSKVLKHVAALFGMLFHSEIEK